MSDNIRSRLRYARTLTRLAGKVESLLESMEQTYWDAERSGSPFALSMYQTLQLRKLQFREAQQKEDAAWETIYRMLGDV
jgi:hypothetical protein